MKLLLFAGLLFYVFNLALGCSTQPKPPPPSCKQCHHLGKKLVCGIDGQTYYNICYYNCAMKSEVKQLYSTLKYGLLLNNSYFGRNLKPAWESVHVEQK